MWSTIYSFLLNFWLWSTGLYSCLTTWVTHLPKLSNPPNRSFLPILLWVELFNILFHFQTIPPTAGVTDRHWAPASLHCNLCHTRYDFVLKLETLHQDEDELFRQINLSGLLGHESINRCWWREIECAFTFYLLIFLLRNPVPIDKVSTTEEGLEACSVGGKKTELE